MRLMPPAYVKPYVKRQKNDTRDAEAICEAVTRPNMRFVPTKTVEQQSCLMLHRARHLFIRQQTAVINSIRAYLAEFGIVAPVGRRGVEQLLEIVADTADRRLPAVARACLAVLGSQLRALKAQILEFDRRIMAWHRSNATSSGWMRSLASVRRWPQHWLLSAHDPNPFPTKKQNRRIIPSGGTTNEFRA
jgi:transposase